MRKVARLVSAGFDGLLQPWDGFIELAEFDHVRANIVVGIAKIRVQLDRALTFCNGIQYFPLKMISPTQKRVSLCRWMEFERMLVELDSTFVIALHLRLIGVLQHFPSASQGLLIHRAIVTGKSEEGQRYEGSSCAKAQPVPSDGAEWKLGQRTETIRELKASSCGENGGNVNRFFNGIGVVLICSALAGAGTLLAQGSTKKSGGANAAAVGRGKSLFQQKCSICHYDNSDQKKIGPGLKGISKRGTFSVNGNKINDESLKTWIENGDQLMPPFKDVLEPAQIKDVVAYVKTL